MWQNSKQNLYKLKLYFKKFMIFFKTKQHPIFGCEIMIDFCFVLFSLKTLVQNGFFVTNLLMILQ